MSEREMRGLVPAGRSELAVAGGANPLVARGLRESSRDRALAHLNRGVQEHEKRNYENAVEQFDIVIHLEPRNVAAYLHRAECWLLGFWKCAADDEQVCRDFDEVIRLCDEAIQDDAMNGTAYMLCAMAWVGKFDRAVHTGNGKHQRELFVESASRNCEEALRLFEQASRKDPENADLWFLRGAALAIIAWSIRKGRYQERRLLLRRLGDFRDRAMTALANAVRLAPANPRYHFLSGNVEEAIRLEPTNELYDVPNSPGRDLPWIGGWDIGALDESIAEDPRFAAAWFTAFRLELYKQRGPFRVYT